MRTLCRRPEGQGIADQFFTGRGLLLQRQDSDIAANLMEDFARRMGIRSVLRGLRAMSDFEYEFQLASMNRRITDEVDFVFLMTSEENFFVSSSLVRDVAMNGGDVSEFVPAGVGRRLKQKFSVDT